MSRSVATAACVASFLLVACASPEEMATSLAGSPLRAPPDLVLLLVAGLRADMPGEPGMAADLLQRLSTEPARVYQNAYAQSPSAFLSLGSLLSGHYPSAVPLCGFTGGARDITPPWCTVLPDDRPTLPDILAIYGYKTALFHTPLRGGERLAPRFQTVEAFPQPDSQARWAALTNAATAWWGRQVEQPSLLVVVSTDLALLPEELGLPLPSLEMEVFSTGRESDTPQVMSRQALLDLYEARTSALGDSLAALVDGLPIAPGGQRLVVLAGLHGLSLMEDSGSLSPLRHAPVSSDIILHRTIHVPLAIFAPGGGPSQAVAQPVELLDILPTLLARASAAPPAGISGQDLLAPEFVEDPQAMVYAEFGDMLAVRQGEHLLTFRTMLHNTTPLNSDLDTVLAGPISPHYLLHDVQADPWQTADLRTLLPERAAALRAALLRIRQGSAAPALQAVSPEHLLELKMTASQGYW